jgi:hypothetical protein
MLGAEFQRARSKRYKRPGPQYEWGGANGILRHDADGVWRLYNPSNPNIYWTLVHIHGSLPLGRFRGKMATVEGWVTPYEWNYPNFNIIPVIVGK